MNLESETSANGYSCELLYSALQKSIRRNLVEPAVHAAYELYLTGSETYEHLWTRLLVISVEDIGLANPQASVIVGSLNTLRKQIDFNSGDQPQFFVQAIRYLCASLKERDTCNLTSVMKRRIKNGVRLEFPDYVFDMHTTKGRSMGRGYAHFLDVAAKVSPRMPGAYCWEPELRKLVLQKEVKHEG